MNFPFPDSPCEVSESLLALLDKETPGTYIATMKADGRRRMCYRSNGVWTYVAKNRTDCEAMPDALKTEFEGLDWPENIGVDVELTGKRMKGDCQFIFVFDLLVLDGQWIGRDWHYAKRYDWLLNCCPFSTHVRLVESAGNPRMVDFYHRQRLCALSEGVVVYHRDQLIIGNAHRSVTGAGLFKIKFERTKT